MKLLRCWRWVIAGLPLMAVGCGGCAGGNAGATGDHQLRELEAANQTARISVSGQPFEVWLALTADQRQQGLMFVPEEEMRPTQDGAERGMLFVFPREQIMGFWMRNTIIPLDIAYIRSDGRIVKIHTMPPLTLQSFPSVEPARFALEAAAGTFQRLGIAEADAAQIPDSVLKRAQ